MEEERGREKVIIYKIVNKINGKIYIGKTISSLEKRITEHLRAKGNWPFPLALKKYGIQSFEFSIIDTADIQSSLTEKEIYWIKFFDCKVPTGYNLTDGGDGVGGHKHTIETRRKMSEVKIGRKNNMFGKKRPDTTALLKLRVGKKNPMFGKHRSGKNNPMFGKYHTPETIRRMVEIKTGKHPTEETRKKMSESQKGKHDKKDNRKWEENVLRGK